MAFNFNWSPLIADTSRARDMLTSALNKSPKPPIIVDDIIVTELNLGSVPPELEILEIGDLAEDRFRGIFKMAYTGDAVLTLTTRVQANPLNTYLSTRPSFVSPQPLAASSGLTIPLQITLSDIRLSGFVILVFSKQKGITLVFRNDPLESLKVSSTFDSIPFVRDYLQNEIEGQLRVLFMEDLPAIIHRLSLQLWSADHHDELGNTMAREQDDTGAQQPINPFASPPVNPADLSGRPLDELELASLSPDTRAEMYASFSQKNLLHLAALTDSHRTLSLFTPPIRDVVFRAWAGASERGDLMDPPPSGFTLASLSRQNHSTASSAGGSIHSYSDTSPTAALSSRASFSALGSAYAASSSAPSRSRTHNGRRRKNRVIDLRHKQQTQEAEPLSGGGSSRPATPASETSSSLHPPSQEREGELITPPQSPEQLEKTPLARPQQPLLVSPQPQAPNTARKLQHTMLDTRQTGMRGSNDASLSASPIDSPVTRPPLRPTLPRRDSSSDSKTYSSSVHPPLPSNGSILEQAWMMKMANEIARRVQAERDQEAAAEAAAAAGLTIASSSGSVGQRDQGGPLSLSRKESGAWSNAATTVEEPPPPAYAA